MSLTLFMALSLVLSAATSLITEAIKKSMDKTGDKYSSNVIVLIVAAIVGVFGTTIAYIFLGTPFSLPNVICIILMPIAIWVGAMLGYDKVVQMLEQCKSLR